MTENGFSKGQRLLSAADFSHLKSGASKLNTRYIRAYFKSREGVCSNTRLGISVSKKVGNAVRRNRTKRIIREFFRTSSFKLLGSDVLLIVSPSLYKDFETIDEAESKLKSSLFGLFRNISEV